MSSTIQFSRCSMSVSRRASQPVAMSPRCPVLLPCRRQALPRAEVRRCFQAWIVGTLQAQTSTALKWTFVETWFANKLKRERALLLCMSAWARYESKQEAMRRKYNNRGTDSTPAFRCLLAWAYAARCDGHNRQAMRIATSRNNTLLRELFFRWAVIAGHQFR